MICAGLLSKLIFLVLRVKSTSPGNLPPPLSSERERECFRLYKEKGDMDARAELIEHNLRLVALILK